MKNNRTLATAAKGSFPTEVLEEDMKTMQGCLQIFTSAGYAVTQNEPVVVYFLVALLKNSCLGSWLNSQTIFAKLNN